MFNANFSTTKTLFSLTDTAHEKTARGSKRGKGLDFQY